MSSHSSDIPRTASTCVYLHSDTKLVYLILSFVCEVSNGVDVNMLFLATFSRGTSSKRAMSVRISCLLAISPPKQRVVFSPKQWCYFPHLPSGRASTILWRSFTPCRQWPSWLLYQLVLTPSIVTSFDTLAVIHSALAIKPMSCCNHSPDVP